MTWRRTLYGAIHAFEQRFDALKERLGRGPSSGALTIVPYLGYGSTERLYVHGRVLRDPGVAPTAGGDGPWRNLLNMYRRAESDEVPGAIVRATFGGMTHKAESDEEGFFNFWLEPGSPEESRELWREVELELLSPQVEEGAAVKARAEVAIPMAEARLAVISDLDDTVIQTHATDWLRMVRPVFLENAHTRLPFPGVATFYRALHGTTRLPIDAAETVAGRKPLFYVSSSPWNLYDLLADFLAVHSIPRAPMFLRDWGISKEEILPTEHSAHKLARIEELLAFYKEMPFILIGDSGQHDPEIYSEVVRRHGRRIRAIYIRDVTDEHREAEVRQLAQEVVAAGSELILAEDTATMARHAAQQGWVAAEDVAAVEEAMSHKQERERGGR